MRRTAPLFVALALATTLAPITTPAAPECDWPMYGHDAGHSFAQPDGCASIAPTNVSTLQRKWFVDTGTPVSASPTVVNGVVYVGDWNATFYALDAETGDEIWSFQSDDTHNVPFGRIVNSAAVDTLALNSGGSVNVVLFAAGATLYALDPSSGSLLASIDVDPRTPAHRAATPNAEVSIESSPVVGHFGTEGDRIFVGMDVHNDAAIGRTGLLAFELKTNTGGTTPYRFEFKYKFDPETETVRTTLTDGSGTGYGCGGVWSSPALDATALNGDGVVVFGTSNCVNNGPDEAQTEANPSEGIFALRAKNGSLLWKFRPRGANPYDDDFGASPNMLPGGLVGEGGKDGTYYAFNRVTGAPAWSSHLGQSGRLNEQFSFGGMIGTTAVGSVTSLLTGPEPAVFAATALSSPVGEPIGTGTPDQWIDESLAEDPGRMFSLHAISAVDGRVLWRTPLSRQAFGAPTYANGVLVVPSTFDFTVKAFHADTGVLLWEHPLNAPPSSAPAIVGDSIYVGAGTSAGGLPLDNFGGIWAFELAA